MKFVELNEKFGGCLIESEWHQHPNGGGWVQNTVTIDATVYVAETARVYGDAQVYGDARVSGSARVYGRAEVEANARLIAAAPELLEALKRLRDAERAPRSEWVAALANADAAIATAEGRVEK